MLEITTCETKDSNKSGFWRLKMEINCVRKNSCSQQNLSRGSTPLIARILRVRRSVVHFVHAFMCAGWLIEVKSAGKLATEVEVAGNQARR